MKYTIIAGESRLELSGICEALAVMDDMAEKGESAVLYDEHGEIEKV